MCPGSCISCSYNYLENFTFSSTSWVNIINHEIIRSLYWECNAEFIFYICYNGMSNNEMCGMKRLHWGGLFIFILGIWNSLILSAVLLVCDGTRPIGQKSIYLYPSLVLVLKHRPHMDEKPSIFVFSITDNKSCWLATRNQTCNLEYCNWTTAPQEFIYCRRFVEWLLLSLDDDDNVVL